MAELNGDAIHVNSLHQVIIKSGIQTKGMSNEETKQCCYRYKELTLKQHHALKL